MRFHDPLDDLLGNPVRLRVLRILARSPSQGFTGHDLARGSKTSPSQTILALRSLEETGIINRQVAGAAHVWRISSKHVLTKPLIELFEEEEGSLDRLKAEVQRAVAGLPVERVFIFGSVARKEERPASDIDLFVEVGSPEDKTRVEDALGTISPEFALTFGNALSAIVLTTSQVSRPSNPSLVENILREGERVVP